MDLIIMKFSIFLFFIFLIGTWVRLSCHWNSLDFQRKDIDQIYDEVKKVDDELIILSEKHKDLKAETDKQIKDLKHEIELKDYELLFPKGSPLRINERLEVWKVLESVGASHLKEEFLKYARGIISVKKAQEFIKSKIGNC